MDNMEKRMVGEILRAAGGNPSGLGLRFDRVAVRVLGDLRAFADAAAIEGLTVLVTISAPIRLPARTADDLKQAIGARLSAGIPGEDESAIINGNAVRFRLVEPSSSRAPRLIGFVHNPDSPARRLLDLAEQGLRNPARLSAP